MLNPPFKISHNVKLMVALFSTALEIQAADTGVYSFDLPAQPLAASLDQLARQSQIKLLYSDKSVQGIKSDPVKGRYTVAQALKLALDDSGLGYEVVDKTLITVKNTVPASQTIDKKIIQPQEPITLSPVNVTAEDDVKATADSGHQKNEDYSKTDSASTLHLDTYPKVASRLGLSIRQTPATVNVISQEQMQQQGIRNMIEAYFSAPGVSAGNNPGEPGVTTMRGFSRAATGYMMDGMHVVDSLLASRNFDSWNFERIEVLKGPSSVINGTGALAGSINWVTKKASLEKRSLEGLFSYGSFDSLRAAIGGNLPVNGMLALRGDFVYSQSSGYINNTDSRTLGITTGALFKPTDRFTFNADFDFFHDHYASSYQGTPLMPAKLAKDPSSVVSALNGYVIDSSIRDINYNASNGLMASDNFWARTKADYQLTKDWHLINEASYLYADRSWTTIDPTFNEKTNLMDGASTLITHNQNIWSERAYANFDGNIFKHHNRFAAGFSYVYTSLDSNRRFGTTTSVDPFNPIPVAFPADTTANFSTRQDFSGSVETISGFMEDALNLTPDWLAIVGLRFEHSTLDRGIYDLNANTSTKFGKQYDNFSWRVGSVYNITPTTQLYGHYSHAVSPVTTLLLSNSLRAGFDMTTGDSFEAGLKTTFWDNRATFTTAFYHITQDNILTLDPTNPRLTVQGGSQRSRGIELDLTVAITPQWKVSGNAALLDATYTQLVESGGVNRAGQTPPNVPNRTYYVSSFYTLPSMPLTFGAIVRGSGSFYTDNTNAYTVNGYTLLDLSLSYKFKNIGTLAIHGRNMTDELYGNWSGYGSQVVYLGAPRSVDFTWTMAF